MKKLKIATFVTSHFTVPPPKGVIYAPMDIAVSLSVGLAKRGHQVDFFAPVGSHFPKLKDLRLVTLNKNPLIQNKLKILKDPSVNGGEEAKIHNLWDQYFLSEIYKKALAGLYDIVHIHPIDRALPWGRALSDVRTVYTLHDPIYPWRAEIFRMFSSRNQHLISISDNQRKPAPDLNYAGTVYNGVDLKQFPFSEKPGQYLLFAGRIIKEKGAAEAIQVAKKTGERLLIVGSHSNDDYWNKKIKPNLGGLIRYIGAVSRENLHKYFQKAKATLLPIRWEEPFGMVMVESMACGTPVIAFNHGSVPEIIKNGTTGFIVKNASEMTRAIKRVGAINRRMCRRHVEEKFSAEVMIRRYEEIFVKLLNSI